MVMRWYFKPAVEPGPLRDMVRDGPGANEVPVGLASARKDRTPGMRWAFTTVEGPGGQFRREPQKGCQERRAER
jgi:hypothetical protein